MTGPLTGSLTVLGIPPSHHHCQLDNFDWRLAPGAVKPVEHFVKETREGRAPHLLMIGPPGTGKSHLLYGLYRWAVLQSDMMAVKVLHVPSYCDSIKKAFDSGLDPYDEVTPAKYLIALDDVFGRELSKYDMKTTIPRLLEIVNHNQSALVATTNYTVAEMGDLLAPHEFDRLLERSLVIEFKGESQRL